MERKEVKIPSIINGKSDILYTLTPIKHVSRIFGLLPVTFSHDKNGRWTGQLDALLIVYGVILVLSLTGAQIWGLHKEFINGLGGSERSSSKTSVIICYGDIYAALSVSLAAVLGSPYRWRNMNNTLKKLVQVDEQLGSVVNYSLRKTSNILIFLSFAFVISTLGTDYILRVIDYEAKKENTLGIEYHSPNNFAPLYFMHLFNLAFGLQYFFIVMHVSERFMGLNEALESLIRINTYVSYIQKDLGLGELRKYTIIV
ncbi:hypothetical protein QAD02_009733 [Eretmocerus hayati]|uniref:Uncharacterized protein n=1 Tax=Eretmocerus hayati TaxID=131215 RepID=A0ACC2NEN9_9HYME|nr:hypothetical protein QAD02_009733 [Eretmocerus hayati]